MTLSEKTTFGFIATVLTLLMKARKALESAGWDVDTVVANLQKLYDAAVLANESQEAAKRQLRSSTESFYAIQRQAFVTASGYLDMAIAAVSKDSDEAKNFRRYRARVRRHEGDAPIPIPVEPTPVP